MGSPFRVAVAAFGSLLLLAPTVRALDQEAVNRAIDKGVIHLKQLQRENGTWPHQELGATSLAGLTLLECGVPPNDPSVRSATQVIRQASITCTHTYSIALSILFLDRLGDPADVPLIESLTVRLLAGQNASGGWTYHCPEIAESEIQRLKKIVNDRKEPAPLTPPSPPHTGGEGGVRGAGARQIGSRPGASYPRKFKINSLSSIARPNRRLNAAPATTQMRNSPFWPCGWRTVTGCPSSRPCPVSMIDSASARALPTAAGATAISRMPVCLAMNLPVPP